MARRKLVDSRVGRCRRLILLVCAHASLAALPAQESEALKRLESGDAQAALDLVTGSLSKNPRDPRMLRIRINLLLGMGRELEAMECAQELIAALPRGLEKESLRAFADRSRQHFERMPNQELLDRLAKLKKQGSPLRMKPMIEVLESRIQRKTAPPHPIVGEFYGSANRFFDKKKAVESFNRCLEESNSQANRIAIVEAVLKLEKGETLKLVLPRSAHRSKELAEVEDRIALATKQLENGSFSKDKMLVLEAKDKTLKSAWALIKKLPKADAEHRDRLRQAVLNLQGACYETLADTFEHSARSRRDAEQSRLRVLAVKNFEKAIDLPVGGIGENGVPAKAWALHRVAVLSTLLTKHHDERRAAYAKHGRVYPEQNKLNLFRQKGLKAILRLQEEFADVAHPSGALLHEIR